MGISKGEFHQQGIWVKKFKRLSFYVCIVKNIGEQKKRPNPVGEINNSKLITRKMS